jgi:hypothetical protein
MIIVCCRNLPLRQQDVHSLTVFLYYMCGISHHSAVVGHIGMHQCMGTNGDIIAYFYATEDSACGEYLHVVANRRTSVSAITQCNHLQTIEVAANGISIQISGIIMFKVSTRPDVRAPDVESMLRRQQPLDEKRAIITHAIIEQIAKSALTCARLDEVPHSVPTVLNLQQIVWQSFV